MLSQLVLLVCLIAYASAVETVLAVYLFSRHGDRTAKSTPPANLTELGYQEILTSGSYFRDRYINSSASSRIAGISSDMVKLSQLSLSAPWDNVLINSAQAFAQGLYPPVGTTRGQEMLRNHTIIPAPLDGYQLVPIQSMASGSGSEDSAWLQGQTNCANALASSNEYFSSDEYHSLLHSTQDFYASIAPMVNHTFTSDQISYKNAYTVFDLLNVASIHNASFESSSLLTDSTLTQLRTLADAHEFALAYNTSSTIRAISGSTLAAQILQGLNQTISSSGTTKLTIQFGAYATFQSFFGLANLTSQNSDFYGIPDYTSIMAFELITASPVPAGSFPSSKDLSVRFRFHNGTTSHTSEPRAYPLFGQQAEVLSWDDFATQMGKFAIGTQADWCKACGNSTGVCASAASSLAPSGSSGSSDSNGSDPPLSNAVAGTIGAMVTLAVILSVEGLILLLAGLRVVSKKSLVGSTERAKA